MTEKDYKIINTFKQRIPEQLRHSIRKLLVFGSRARGDATEDSDLDILVLVEKGAEGIERALDDIAYEVMWDFDFHPIISLKVLSEDRFEENAHTKDFSFYRSIVREGLPA